MQYQSVNETQKGLIEHQIQEQRRSYTCTCTRVGPPFHLNVDATSRVRLSTPFLRLRSIQISRAARSPSSTSVSSERRSFDSESARLNVITIMRKSTWSVYVQGLPVTQEPVFESYSLTSCRGCSPITGGFVDGLRTSPTIPAPFSVLW